MKNFTEETVMNHFDNSYNVFTEAGFHSALVVAKRSGVFGNNVEEWREVVPLERIGGVFGHALEGGTPQSSRLIPHWEESYYWLVPLQNGGFYPWPLLFCSQEHRQLEADKRNGELWRQFYAGVIDSKTLRCSLRSAPSEDEIEQILANLEAYIAQGDSPWDEYDQQGGLVPRWAS